MLPSFFMIALDVRLPELAGDDARRRRNDGMVLAFASRVMGAGLAAPARQSGQAKAALPVQRRPAPDPDPTGRPEPSAECHEGPVRLVAGHVQSHFAGLRAVRENHRGLSKLKNRSEFSKRNPSVQFHNHRKLRLDDTLVDL